ncbi:siderophore-interacting protein [Dyella sp.]|uniref:siderophore-interacting protein n=1 Tax=Dyella sp. TaxID=1869338 RepID=UPI002ED2D622
MAKHEPRMVRHTVVFRLLDVLRVIDLTPHMRRIVLGGPELTGFLSAAPDDHVKLFFPNSQGQLARPTMGPQGLVFPDGVEPSPMRDYTPRIHDEANGELTIDFVLHGDGPAATWAARAAPGQQIAAGGPRGSYIVADDYDHYLLIGDETALPAIGRWLEELPANARATALIEIPEAADRQALQSHAHFDVQWLDRRHGDAATSQLLEQALAQWQVPEGDTFYWIATESRRARAMRQWLNDERGIEKEHVKATGYWKAGPEDD